MVGMASPNLRGQVADVTTHISKCEARSVWGYRGTGCGEKASFDGGSDRRITWSLLPRADSSEVAVAGIFCCHDCGDIRRFHRRESSQPDHPLAIDSRTEHLIPLLAQTPARKAVCWPISAVKFDMSWRRF